MVYSTSPQVTYGHGNVVQLGKQTADPLIFVTYMYMSRHFVTSIFI